jgi:CO dehydrogenase maturation factor
MCASHRAVRGLIAELSGYGEHTVTDMEAGLEHMKRGTARNVDVMLIVAEPYYRSLEAAERTYSLARELAIPHIFVVANKIKTNADQKAVDEFCARHGMPIIGTVPHDDELVEADRRALAPIDHAPDCTSVRAIVAIADKLRALPSPGGRQQAGLAARPQT